MIKSDVCIVGGGLVGLATAFRISQSFPALKLLLIEKEKRVAAHQSSHNSGVIHSGIYYKPGSLKAINCRNGKRDLIEFCERFKIDYKICGKVIVAVSEDELPNLHLIYERGVANGVDCRLISADELRNIEPYVSGKKAIHVPEAGIVDFPALAIKLQELLTEKGCEIHLNTELKGINFGKNELVLGTTVGDIQTKYLINCAGLYSDKILKFAGIDQGIRIVPFRGEYFKLKKEAEGLCRSLIYPVPDPAFPFLGVHFTRMIDGCVECGPNAVLGLAREAYKKSDINLAELLETISFAGFRKFASKHWRAGVKELYRSISKHAFLSALQRLVPQVELSDLLPAEAGVRAQAVSHAGKVLDDFSIYQNKSMLHVLNAPSPAATSCLSIGKELLEMAKKELQQISSD